MRIQNRGIIENIKNINILESGEVSVREISKEVREKIVSELGIENIFFDAPMDREVSFKAGGKADIFIVPQNLDELIKAIVTARNYDIPLFIMGNGSNFIVRDEGFKGAIVKISSQYFNEVTFEEDLNLVNVQAGMLMSSLAREIQKRELTGFEFASGIPGSIGGAIFMNAGAYGGEMRDIVTKVRALDYNGNIVEFTKQELDFSYRHSIFHENKMVILDVTMELKKGKLKDIKEKTEELTRRRNEKQPVHLPSAGSFFKRPEGYYAGKLIQDAGLKGYKIGGAMVSDMHSGFIVNVENATATDIINLKEHIQKEVFEKFQVRLEPEIRILGG